MEMNQSPKASLIFKIQPSYRTSALRRALGSSGGLWRVIASAIVAAFICFSDADPASADFKLCNTTSSRVGVAIGYKDPKGWATEGWWNLASNTCETLLKGNLIARYYYIHAVDYDRGGEWAGKSFMCTDSKSFTVRDVSDCAKRGFERNGFFEVDTGEERDWTVRLTEPSNGGVKK